MLNWRASVVRQVARLSTGQWMGKGHASHKCTMNNMWHCTIHALTRSLEWSTCQTQRTRRGSCLLFLCWCGGSRRQGVRGRKANNRSKRHTTVDATVEQGSHHRVL